MILLLVALTQVSLDESAAAFAKGDDAPRAAILRAGPYGIGPLRKVRGRSPERVDALVLDLKAAVGGPDAALLEAFRKETEPPLVGGRFLIVFEDLREDLRLLLDPGIWELVDKPVKVGGKCSRRERLDAACRDAGLDYGFAYGGVVVSTAERLWPSGPPPAPPRALAAEEAARARKWVEELDHESFETREEATKALKALGAGAVPLLEEGAKRAQPELAYRCRDLLALARRGPPAGLFGRPAAERQKLEGDDAALYQRLRESQSSIKVSDIVIDGCLRLCLQPRNIPYRGADATRRKRVTLDLMNVSGATVVSLVCHANGLDFMIRDGAVYVDSKEEIEALVGKAK